MRGGGAAGFASRSRGRLLDANALNGRVPVARARGLELRWLFVLSSKGRAVKRAEGLDGTLRLARRGARARRRSTVDGRGRPGGEGRVRRSL